MSWVLICIRYNADHFYESTMTSNEEVQLYILHVHVQLHDSNLRLCCFLMWQQRYKTSENNYAVKSAENTNRGGDLCRVTGSQLCVKLKLKPVSRIENSESDRSGMISISNGNGESQIKKRYSNVLGIYAWVVLSNWYFLDLFLILILIDFCGENLYWHSIKLFTYISVFKVQPSSLFNFNRLKECCSLYTIFISFQQLSRFLLSQKC